MNDKIMSKIAAVTYWVALGMAVACIAATVTSAFIGNASDVVGWLVLSATFALNVASPRMSRKTERTLRGLEKRL